MFFPLFSLFVVGGGDGGDGGVFAEKKKRDLRGRCRQVVALVVGGSLSPRAVTRHTFQGLRDATPRMSARLQPIARARYCNLFLSR